MAIVAAIQNGLWSSSTTWPGGVLPTTADDVFANSRTVYINQDINVLSLNTTASGVGGSASGLFYNTGSVSITALRILPGTTSVLTLTGNNNIFIRSNLISGSYTTTNAWGVIIPGASLAPNVSVSSYISGGTFAGVTGGIRQEAGTLSVSGVIVGGSSNAVSPGIYIINVGDYPVNFTGYGRVEGGDLVVGSAGINIAYTGQEFSNRNSSFTFYGTVSGSPRRSNVNNGVSAAIRCATTIPVNIYGDVIGGSGGTGVGGLATGQSAIIMEGTNLINVFGNVFSGIAGLSAGNTATITPGGGNTKTLLNIVGNIVNTNSLNNAICLNFRSTGTVNITGNIISNTGNLNSERVVLLGGSTIMTVYGNVSGGRGTGINMIDTAPVLNIYGDVYGGNTTTTDTPGISIGGSTRGKINVYGTVTPGLSTRCHGIYYGGNNDNFTVFARELKGSNFGDPALNTNQIARNFAVGAGVNVSVLANHPNVICEKLTFGRFGSPPIETGVTFLDTSKPTITMPITSTSTQTKTLVSPNINDTMPLVSSVRQGIAYGGSLIGTCSMPEPQQVEIGIPVNNTVGVAALRPSNIWNTSTTTLTSLSTTIGYRLNNAATSETVGQLVAAFSA